MSGNTLKNALKEQGIEIEEFSFKHILHERIVCSNTFNGKEVNLSEFDTFKNDFEKWREMNPNASEKEIELMKFFDISEEVTREMEREEAKGEWSIDRY
jgi:uridine phosphorylase